MRIIALPLEWCARHSTKLLAVGVLLGLAVPPLADLLRPLLAPVIVLTLALALLRIDLKAMSAYARRPGLVAILVVFLMLVSPVVVAAVARPFELPPGLLAGLVLMAAAPPIMSAPAFALILGLDAALAVVVALVCHMVVPLTLPPLSLWLIGLELDVGIAELMLRLGLVVGIAFALAYGVRRWAFSPEFLVRNSRRIDGLAVIGLVIFACAIMAGVTEFLLQRPGYVLLTAATAFLANASLQVAGALAFYKTGRREALTIGLMTGNCNMGLVLATLADRADMDIVVFFAIGQLPMYMLPIVVLPIYRRLI